MVWIEVSPEEKRGHYYIGTYTLLSTYYTYSMLYLSYSSVRLEVKKEREGTDTQTNLGLDVGSQ